MYWFLPDLNEAFILTSAVLIGAGWWAIRHKHVRWHRRLMFLGSLSASLFFLSYVFKTVVLGDTSFGGPRGLLPVYTTFLDIHTTLATFIAILGIITWRRALRRRFALHKKIAPWTAGGWMVTAATGLTVFLLLYVIFPSGPTTGNLLKLLGG
jgi:putative membrane protein